MPLYRFTPKRGSEYRGGGPRRSWTALVSKARVLHYAAWHDVTFEVAPRRSRRHTRDLLGLGLIAAELRRADARPRWGRGGRR